MGRALMYAALAVLAVLVLSSFVVLKHGDAGLAQPKSSSVHELTTNSASFKGDPVTTTGILQYDSSRGLYVIIDDSGQGENFAIVVRPEKETPLPLLVGKHVKVSGDFDYEPVTGPFIEKAYVSEESATPATTGI
jgi:hypothetical protein